MRTPNRRAFMNPAPSDPEPAPSSASDIDRQPATNSLPTSAQDINALEKYDRLLRRLHWKGQLLFYSHQVASDHCDQDAVLAQFKLDFFEFYTLLERTLVHLLAIFRIQVAKVGPAADRPSSPVKAAMSRNGSPLKKATRTETQEEPKLSLVGSRVGPSNHRFHMNVLQALDQPGPLHNVLGTGTVREYLDYAKDLRNRWKDVGEGGDASRGIPQLDGDGSEDVSRQLPAKIELIQVLERVFEGLHAARALVEEELHVGTANAQHDKGDKQCDTSLINDHENMAMELDHDAPYEVVTDDMEIE